jgi:hypothetical protein
VELLQDLFEVSASHRCKNVIFCSLFWKMALSLLLQKSKAKNIRAATGFVVRFRFTQM